VSKSLLLAGNAVIVCREKR